MNPFEEAINNCPYSTDFYEMRCDLARICESFIQKSEWHHIYEKEIKDTKFRSVVFFIYDSLYVWTDTIVDGKLESSQLDKPYNDIQAEVLYCNVENACPFTPLLFKLIDQGEVTQIC